MNKNLGCPPGTAVRLYREDYTPEGWAYIFEDLGLSEAEAEKCTELELEVTSVMMTVK